MNTPDFSIQKGFFCSHFFKFYVLTQFLLPGCEKECKMSNSFGSSLLSQYFSRNFAKITLQNASESTIIGKNRGGSADPMWGECAMEELKERIVREGRVLPGNIIKVDGFLNHRIDTSLMDHIAVEFGRCFDMDSVSMILTVEASGIALAAICAAHYGKPMIFAKKAKSDNIEGGLYQSDIYSYTYKKKVTLLVSREWLSPGDRVLIIDDFLANGEAIRGLCDIVSQAGATLVGVGCAVEKGFQGGGDKLRASGVNLKSLVIIESAEPGRIVFRDEQ